MNGYVEAGYISVFSILAIYGVSLVVRIKKIRTQVFAFKKRQSGDDIAR